MCDSHQIYTIYMYLYVSDVICIYLEYYIHKRGARQISLCILNIWNPLGYIVSRKNYIWFWPHIFWYTCIRIIVDALKSDKIRNIQWPINFSFFISDKLLHNCANSKGILLTKKNRTSYWNHSPSHHSPRPLFLLN